MVYTYTRIVILIMLHLFCHNSIVSELCVKCSEKKHHKFTINWTRYRCCLFYFVLCFLVLLFFCVFSMVWLGFSLLIHLNGLWYVCVCVCVHCTIQTILCWFCKTHANHWPINSDAVQQIGVYGWFCETDSREICVQKSAWFQTLAIFIFTFKYKCYIWICICVLVRANCLRSSPIYLFYGLTFIIWNVFFFILYFFFVNFSIFVRQLYLHRHFYDRHIDWLLFEQLVDDK